jgi:hypothetical protein
LSNRSISVLTQNLTFIETKIENPDLHTTSRTTQFRKWKERGKEEVRVRNHNQHQIGAASQYQKNSSTVSCDCIAK